MTFSRNKLTYLLLILTSLACAQNNYVVIAVEGNIRSEANGSLKAGSVINSNDKVKLNVPYSRALLVCEEGRTLEIKAGATVYDGFVSVTSVLKEPNYHTFHSDKTLESALDNSTLNVIGDVLRVGILEEKYQNTSKGYFFVSYKYGTQHINQKVLVNNNELVFIKHRVFNYAGRPLTIVEAKDVELYFHDNANNSSKKIATFNLSYLDRTLLMREESYLIAAYKSAGIQNRTQIVDKSVKFFQDAYGEFDQRQLTNFVNSIVSL